MTQTFNTPLEAGLRALFLLASGRRGLDLQRIVYFDYVLVHSGDVDGPPSLHPATPSQHSQLLVRRALIQDGLELMRSRDLVARNFRASGILYSATPAGRHVASEFDSAYAARLRVNAGWVAEHLGAMSDRELAEFIGSRAPLLGQELISATPPGAQTQMGLDA